MRLKQLQQKLRQKLYVPERNIATITSLADEIGRMEEYIGKGLGELFGTKKRRGSRRR